MDILIILSLALAIDLALGEPPRVIHPVVWMGKMASLLGKGAAGHSSRVQFLYGLGMVLITLGVFVVSAYFLLFYLKGLSFVAYVVVGAVLLKTTFSLRGLWRAARNVRRLLLENKLTEARFELRSLVSRDTTNLDEGHLVSATVESVAENSSDSFVAPLFYFLLFGVPGAVAYRVVNTFDTMIGYHGQWEYLGKFAARLDDVVNYLPARFTALMIVITAWMYRKDVSGACRVMLRDHNKTQSPNAGWIMSAAAGSLGVQLEKVGHYKLGDNRYRLSPETIGASLQVMGAVALVWSLVCISVGGVCFVLTA